MKYAFRHIVFAVFTVSSYLGIAQQTYFSEHGNREEKNPSAFKINTTKLDAAAPFAIDHGYSGSKDLRQAIVKGFEREPYHNILGPTKTIHGANISRFFTNSIVYICWYFEFYSSNYYLCCMHLFL